MSIVEKDITIPPQKEFVLKFEGNFKAVLLNNRDEAYLKVLLDNVSRDFFAKNLHRVSDILMRTLIWRSFYDMVRDGKMSSEEYIDFFINAIPQERSEDLITNQFQFLPVVLSAFTPKEFIGDLSSRVFQFVVKYVTSIPKDKQNLVLAVKGALAVASKD